ncbi:LegC family aminotransferase [Catenovulum sp. SM1970]|uniref:LegC family aminotransferase n=1 Tax=Marinifaba aquimaris TaxID=2741323 RepID=UPI001572EAEE|nr:LegC family aminotransferase [Marinifaba aquimaris]NTS75366.1 LegC family aminotransferase [Marinifaba aquimaris]
MSNVVDSQRVVSFIRDLYKEQDFIPLHAPIFKGNEAQYVNDTLASTFVSSVGAYVDKFEGAIKKYTNAKGAVATVNGTAALHTALHLAGVSSSDYVITQALTFVATANAINQVGAIPLFVDVCEQTLGLCPISLETYLDEDTFLNEGGECIDKKSGKRVKAILPMHTFGHPCDLDALIMIAKKHNLVVIEDAAESLGSFYKGRHTGTFGDYAAISFNGNKIITTGSGGMVLTRSLEDEKKGRHITTTAKTPHPYEYVHDQVGFNYRLANLNAALGCAQMEKLELLLKSKREIASAYKHFFVDTDYQFVAEPKNCRSNYWLNAIICPDEKSRQQMLEFTNNGNVMTRPVWTLINELPMYADAPCANDLPISQFLSKRLLNLPSSAIVE